MPTSTSSDGAKIYYEDFGGAGVPLVFFHVWGGSSTLWDDVVNQLDRDVWRLITIDYRGHGRSDKPMSGYTLDQFSDDVVCVLDAADIDKCVFVGISMSCKFMQYCILNAPQRVMGQMIINAAPASSFSPPEAVKAKWLALAGDENAWFEDAKNLFLDSVPEDVIRRKYVSSWSDIPQHVLKATFDMAALDFSDRLHEILVPSLCVSGRFDVGFPTEMQKNLVAKPLKNSTFIVVDTNHMFPIDNPDLFCLLLSSFGSAFRR